MKKFYLLCFTLLVAALVICPNAWAAKKITLTYVDHNPETGIAAQRSTVPLLDNIEKATNGVVEFERYFGETLCKSKETWDAQRNGIADVGWMVLSYWPGRTPLSDAFGMPPGQYYNTAKSIAGAMWKAYEKYPAMQKEFTSQGIRPLLFFTSEPKALTTINKQVKTLADLKGLKIRCLGGVATTQMKVLGGTPMLTPMPDCYLALQKGVMDGMENSAEAISTWRFYEVTKYITYAPLPGSYNTITIAERTWQKLPADVQEQIMSVCGHEGSMWYADNFYGYFVDILDDTIAKAGYKMEAYTLPPDEFDRWIAASEPVFEEYFTWADGKGVGKDARAIVDDILNGRLH